MKQFNFKDIRKRLVAAIGIASTPIRLFTLATVVSCGVFAADRALSESVIIPSQFENRQGSQVIGGAGNPGRFRFHILYPGSEFPQQPIDIIGMRLRPKSGTPTQTVRFQDVQLSLTTTKEALLRLDFDANLDNALLPPTPVINGTVELSTFRPVPDQSPRPFDYEFNWKETPFRYNPLDGTNLLVDFGNPFGFSVSPQFDATSVPNGRVILQTPELANRGESPYYYHLFVTELIYRPAGDCDCCLPLEIQWQNGQALVSWPASGSNCVLEATANLAASAWTNSSPPTLVSNRWQALESVDLPWRFYRLAPK